MTNVMMIMIMMMIRMIMIMMIVKMNMIIATLMKIEDNEYW